MRKRPNPSNYNLISAIKRRKWDNIYQHLNEANFTDDDNRHALHVVCSDSTAPMNAVVAIYNQFPEAIKVRDKNQNTPISIAVEINFEPALNFLVQACPQAVLISSLHNSSPIQLAVDKLTSNNMIDSILDANPEAAFIPDATGESTFHDFFQFLNVFVRLIVCDQNISCNTLDDAIGHGDWTIREVYHKACLFLKAGSRLIWHDAPDNLSQELILHLSLKFKSCHYAFCKLILKLHPEQALKKDFDGNLPIHILLASQEVSDEGTFLCMDCFTLKSKLIHMECENGATKFCCEDCFQYDPKTLKIERSFSIQPVEKVHEMAKELITIAPQMAFIPDIKGNYPLHMAIKNQHSFDIVIRLYKAIVEVGMIRDVTTRLLPFMLAAVGYWKNERDQLSITYQLLREDPHLLN